MEENAEITLRETLADAVSAAETANPEPEVTTPQPARDEAGRFAEKTETPPAKTAPAKTAPEQKSVAQAHAEEAAPVQQPAIKVPSTWKKDYHPHYQKLAAENPELANYILDRESQYANGVSTYKQEVDRLKPLSDAVTPFMDDLRAHNLQPDQWIRQIGEVHQRLVRGSPEQKIQTLQWLANNYGVSLGAIQTGQVDPIMSHLQPLQDELRQVKGQLTSWQEQQQQREMASLQQDVQKFASDPKNVHYEAVRETMAELLQSGVAKDLQSAYDKAVRLNDDVWQSEQLRLQNERAEQQKAEQAAKVNKARSSAVSVRSSTPGVMSGAGNSDLRSVLSDAFEAAGGRV